MALDTTVGGASANSYASVAEADAYHVERLAAVAWTGAALADKESALIMAARLLDAMPQAWTGAAVTDVQALRWPRKGMLTRNDFPIAENAIPKALKDAQAEFARQLIESDRLGDADVANLGITRVKAGSVEVAFEKRTSDEQAGDVIPDNLTADPAGKLMVPDVVRVMLVPSWLLPTIAQESAQAASQVMFDIW